MTQARHRAALAALATLADPNAWPERGFGTQARIFTARSLRGIFGDRRAIFTGLTAPLVLLLMFSQVFRATEALPQVAADNGYVNFLVPATLVGIATTGAVRVGEEFRADLAGGFGIRLRCLPISMLALLTGHALGGLTRLAVQSGLTVLASAVVLGFHPAGGFPDVLAALIVTLAVGWGLSWSCMALATRKRDAGPPTSVALFPLMFTGGAYLPLDSMPDWVRAIASIDPLAYPIEACRALANAQPAGASIVVALAIAAIANLGGGFAAVRTFRRFEPPVRRTP